MTGVLEIAAGIVLGGILLAALPYVAFGVLLVIAWLADRVSGNAGGRR